MPGSKFVDDFSMVRGHRYDHVGSFWHDADDLNHAQCVCGWDGEDDDAQALYDRWGAHVDAIGTVESEQAMSAFTLPKAGSDTLTGRDPEQDEP